MANTYSQIHIQVVFAVESRQCLIRPEFREEVQKYISGIAAERQHKLLAIYCMPDHTHLLIGLRPAMALSVLVRDVKIGASNLINGKGWVRGRFSWQEGFGAFSYGHSQIPGVIQYIRDQPAHHRTKSFVQEYVQLLRRFEIDHDEKYVFHEANEGR